MRIKFLSYYFKYKDSIYNYFLYRLNFDKHLAEDFTSEVFLKAFKNFDNFDDKKASFKTWTLTIAHNLLLNFYRDNKKNDSVEEMDLRGVEVEDEKYLNQLINGLEIKLIIDKIQSLPSNYSQVLVLRLINQLSYKEISDITGQKEGSIRVLFLRGIEKLNLQTE